MRDFIYLDLPNIWALERTFQFQVVQYTMLTPFGNSHPEEQEKKKFTHTIVMKIFHTNYQQHISDVWHFILKILPSD